MKTDVELIEEVKTRFNLATYRDVAIKIGVPETDMSNIRAGKRALPLLKKIRAYDLLGYAWASEALQNLF